MQVYRGELPLAQVIPVIIRQEIPSLAKRLLASQEELSSVELVN
jgi:hypothetical protein